MKSGYLTAKAEICSTFCME